MNLDIFIRAFNILISECNRGNFKPLLEADISGYIYHLLLNQGLVQAQNIHLDSRVVGARKNQKFDIVIGTVVIRDDGRPATMAEVIIEIKSFPIGFGDSQHYVHFKHIINDDIPKLASVKCPTKIELLFDDRNYLSGMYYRQVRMDIIRKERDRYDSSINVLWLPRQKDNFIMQQT